MSTYSTGPLTPDTWDAFAAMVERHNGVFGGCWCTWFHTRSADKERTYEANRSLKHRLVQEGEAHAALVHGRAASRRTGAHDRDLGALLLHAHESTAPAPTGNR